MIKKSQLYFIIKYIINITIPYIPININYTYEKLLNTKDDGDVEQKKIKLKSM